MTTSIAERSTPTPAGVIAARTQDAVKVYGRGQTAVRALDGVTVSFPAGEFTAIMGPSGSGKSTLLHCLAGLDDLTSGQAFIGDAELGSLGDDALTRLRRDRIGFVFQNFNLLPTLAASENLVLPLRLAGRKADQVWLDTVIDTLGLRDRLGHRPAELSGGQQQRVAVGRALVTRPAIIFADEPTGNLDSRAGAEVLGFMRRAVDDMGQTIVMVTHDPIAAGYADRIVFLADGKVVDTMIHPSADKVLDRMKRFGPELHCVVSLTEEIALRQAKRADAEIAAGKYRGPLHGVPYGIKDLFSVRGTRTTWGVKIYVDRVIDADAAVAKRLEDAGAVLAAKLSLG